ncbi:MAG: UDP-N-acetylmuramoyl-L-alanyl-D-glutamate--2,6-diaminopimelate ligase [Caldicoprobacterales bacterium]
MKLSDIMEGIHILEYTGNTHIPISDICYHSHKAKPGSVFVAIQGLRSDGHQFIADALSKGACAVVVSKELHKITALTDLYGKVTVIRVRETRSALSRMAANLCKHPSKALNMIGVTGTNGKTTIAYLVHAILERYEGVGQIGSLGIFSGHEWKESSHTTPESLELQKILKDMLDSGLKSCIMEVSSHALELGRVRDIDFDAAIFSNLTHEHMDFHKSMENYYIAKRRLFYMTNRFNVINIDDPYGKRLASELTACNQAPIITYGIKEDADCRAHSVRMLGNHTELHIITPAGDMTLRILLPGRYNVYNCLAAVACTHMLGLGLSEIKALEQVKQIPGRFEVIPAGRNVNIIIDYAHTPDGFQQLLETVSGFAKGRIVMVFGCVGERDQSKRSVMGEIASRYSDLCILTTDNCRSENPKDIIEQIKKGFSIGTNYVEILDREAAIRYAILNSKENDTILVTGKGHEKKQVIGNITFYFDERKIVDTALKDLSRQMGISPARLSVEYRP